MSFFFFYCYFDAVLVLPVLVLPQLNKYLISFKVVLKCIYIMVLYFRNILNCLLWFICCWGGGGFVIRVTDVKTVIKV